MKLTDLQDFFDDNINADSFKELIRPEIQEYQKRAMVIGRSRPITVVNNAEIIVSSRQIAHLCSAYIRGEFTEAEVAYIADAILLSHVAQDLALQGEDLADLVEELTDPEINGPLTRERALDVLVRLTS